MVLGTFLTSGSRNHWFLYRILTQSLQNHGVALVLATFRTSGSQNHWFLHRILTIPLQNRASESCCRLSPGHISFIGLSKPLVFASDSCHPISESCSGLSSAFFSDTRLIRIMCFPQPSWFRMCVALSCFRAILIAMSYLAVLRGVPVRRSSAAASSSRGASQPAEEDGGASAATPPASGAPQSSGAP